MNNRYLYRAKRKNWRELPKEVWWVEGYYAFVDNHHYIYTGNLCNGGLYVVAERFEIDIATLCACTGLKDKNEKLIWENDIVKHFYNKDEPERYDIGVVQWDGVHLSFRRTSKTDEKLVNLSFYSVYEVIGNIFDNPELLEVGE